MYDRGDPTRPPSSRPPAHRRRRGFTLIEAALTIVIVGVGILGSMSLAGALTAQNATASQATTAMLLASNVQEAMAGLSFNDPAYANAYFGPEPGEAVASYNDVDDFDGKTFSPPIDAARQPIAGLSQYSQVVSVVPVFPTKLNSNLNSASLEIPKSVNTGAIRVQVRVLYRRVPSVPAVEVYRSSWIRTAS